MINNITQKQVANQYSFLNGKQVMVYIGRISCNMKHIEKELSVIKKENEYGMYEQIVITIRKTNFNGIFITIYPKYFPITGTLLQFKLTVDNINKLQILN